VSIYPFIEAEKAQQHSVKRACELLKVSRAAYYAARRGPSRRDRADAVLVVHVKAVHAESKGRYGAPRVHAELARRGHHHGRKRIARLMRSSGLHGRAARRWRKTTIPNPSATPRADLIRRDFTTDASWITSRWCGDITTSPPGRVAVPGHGHRHRVPPRRRVGDGRSPMHTQPDNSSGLSVNAGQAHPQRGSNGGVLGADSAISVPTSVDSDVTVLSTKAVGVI
jgi:hypothetical protein